MKNVTICLLILILLFPRNTSLWAALSGSAIAYMYWKSQESKVNALSTKKLRVSAISVINFCDNRPISLMPYPWGWLCQKTNVWIKNRTRVIWLNSHDDDWEESSKCVNRWERSLHQILNRIPIAQLICALNYCYYLLLRMGIPWLIDRNRRGNTRHVSLALAHQHMQARMGSRVAGGGGGSGDILTWDMPSQVDTVSQSPIPRPIPIEQLLIPGKRWKLLDNESES